MPKGYHASGFVAMLQTHAILDDQETFMQPFAVQIIAPLSAQTTFVVVAAVDRIHAMQQAARHGRAEQEPDNDVVAAFDMNQVEGLAKAMFAAQELIRRAA